MTRPLQVVVRAVAVLIAAAASTRAGVMYTFAGTGISASPEPVAFQLTVADFITPPLNRGFVAFACTAFDTSTNCDSTLGGNAVSFWNQSAFNPLSAQILFDASNGVGYTFLFSTGAFGAPGTYSASSFNGSQFNSGTLTVSVSRPDTAAPSTPEPGTLILVLAGAIGLWAIRWAIR